MASTYQLKTSAPRAIVRAGLVKAAQLLIIAMLGALILASPTVAQKAVKPEPIPPRLLTDLKSLETEKRRAAADQLGAIRNRDAVPHLIAALTDKEAAVREACAFALGQITDRRAVAPLTKALADKDTEVRAAIAFALGMIGDRKSAQTFSALLEDPAATVRSAAIIGMGLMQDEEGVDELFDMLDDPAFDVRFDAAWALGQFNEADAIDHLREAITNIDRLPIDNALREEFRLQAQTSIERIQAQDAGYTPTRPRKTTEGVIANNRYNNESNPAGIRQMVHALPTEKARTAHLHGTVKIKLLVAADGRPARAYVVRRLGYGLDQRAVQAVLQYKFEPAMLSGLPQTGWIFIDVKF
ncbi:MAG: TonB family protein [Acidobacteria bacterium]|nr:TonB family protein [Acidobacteriota bacterium]